MSAYSSRFIHCIASFPCVCTSDLLVELITALKNFDCKLYNFIYIVSLRYIDTSSYPNFSEFPNWLLGYFNSISFALYKFNWVKTIIQVKLIFPKQIKFFFRLITKKKFLTLFFFLPYSLTSKVLKGLSYIEGAYLLAH